MKSMEDVYLIKLEEHKKACKEARDYALGRMDILVISLSTGALGFTFDYVKDLKNIDLTILYWAWSCFAFTIISNLISQFTSYEAHQIEIKIVGEIIEARKKGRKTENLRSEKKKRLLSKITQYLNYIALFTIITGIGLTVYFMFKIKTK